MVGGFLGGTCRGGEERPFGITERALAQAYLGMPDRDTGEFPPKLSQTGAFADTAKLIPVAGLLPYDLNVSFFSDGATKARWMSVPTGGSGQETKIGFSPAGEWRFPNGTVFVKHFDLATNELRPELRRRLETRLLVRDAGGAVYGVTYKWRPDNSDADLLATNLVEAITIRTASGVRTQFWNYPSRQDCRTCHTDLAGGVLGPKTRQINRDFQYPGGVTDNQLRTWNHLDLFDAHLGAETMTNYVRLAAAHDTTRSVEDRARSYLDANCAHCHRPGGTVGYFDARYDTPLARQNLVEGPVLIDQGIDKARIISPNDLWRSIAYFRVNTLEPMKMPPLAHEQLDEAGRGLLKEWIQSLPGPRVLSPPGITAKSDSGGGSTEVVLSQDEPGAAIHYTTDGSAPGANDPVYREPLHITGAAIVRARAYKAGFTRSIPVQQMVGTEK
ncbi:MAG TPA: chitobiase/beta-hexosaminidase C-terminal domain-containing protein [Candidatus Limnocylindria bacterium]|nr:chitobiase/beta-hexosaminidase C-terminal domain-containing protein [Candidatus Limnocylindria bacterium]